MSQLGYDSIFGPGCVCSNMAQATAGAVVAFVTKDKTTKEQLFLVLSQLTWELPNLFFMVLIYPNATH